MTKRCICQICTCGRHRCPHNPRGIPQGKFECTFSEYASKYPEHPVEPRKNFKPQEKPVAGQGPLDDKTTHKVDYIEHPLEKRQLHQPEKYQAPQGDMDTMTNYSKEYTKKPIEKVQMVKREDTRKVPGKFEGEPTYIADYRQWGLQPRERVTADNTYYPNENPFEGISHYQNDYIKHAGGTVRQSMKPDEAHKVSDQPFDDATAYNQSYIKHALPPKEVREKTVWEPNQAKLDDNTNYRLHYTPKAVNGKQASCKPDATPYKSTLPFEGYTTQKTDFIEWPTERFHGREREIYQKPEGEMHLDTTTAMDYTKKQGERQVATKPQDSRKVPGKFDGTTNYTTEFRQWPTEARQMTMKDVYEPNAAPFEGQPTYQRDYIGHGNVGRTVSLKPVDLGYTSGAPLEDGTEYRQEYIKKKADPCPAIYLSKEEVSRAHGYEYREQDQVGHKWYDCLGNPAVKA